MNTIIQMPSIDEMYQALLRRDSQYEGVFFVGVRTTGVFCRPTCSARKPKPENVEYYRTASDALAAGYRPCRRCRPLEAFGAAPDWLNGLLAAVEKQPGRRWTDEDLRSLSLQPARVRRWFKQNHGMTFHAYLRTRRLASAMGQIRKGKRTTQAALDNGYESLSGFRDAFKQWFGDSPSGSNGSSTPIIVNRILTPLGPMIAAAVDHGLCMLEFADRRILQTQFKRVRSAFAGPMTPGHHKWISQVGTELDEYFAGHRRQFDVPLAMGGTDFQMSVWRQLQKIPYGQSTSYEKLARQIRRAGAQRAVGRANGDNRLAIIIPCHRVVRSDGTLCGYGGGLWRKQWLLDHEQMP